MRAAIIDMDGTILDSLGMWSKIDRDFLEIRRNIPVPEDYFKIISPMTPLETAQYTIARFKMPDTPEELMAEWDEMALEEYRTNIPLKPHAAEFLARLKEMGIKTALCTSASESYYEPALKRLGVYNFFDAFATTAEVGEGKRFASIYRLCAKRLGVGERECTAFDDVPEAIMGARAAGMKTCGVFDARNLGEMEYMKQICDKYIIDLNEFFQ